MFRMKRETIQKLGFVILIMIPVLIYLPYYLRGQVPGDSDLVKYFEGYRYLSKCILNGEFPQWNRYLAGGMPQAGAGGFYPVTILFSFLPLKQFLYLFFVFHLIVGSFFFYCYLRESKCSWIVSMVMAVIYECSIQINGMRKGHPMIIAAICLFPVIMFLVRKFFNTRQNRWLCLSALAAALQATAVQQYSIYADLLLLIYILIFCIHDRFRFLDIIKKGVMWVAVYVGMFAFALIPILNLIREYGQYGSSQTSYETFSSYSIHPVKIIQMVIPRFFGEIYQPLGSNYSSEMDIEIYLGIFVLLLAVSAMIRNKSEMIVKVELICAVFAFLYASVAHIPGLNHFVYNLPFLGSFRCAGRMMFVFYFFMLCLAARGLEGLCQKDDFYSSAKRVRRMSSVILAATVSLMVAGAFAVSLFSVSENLAEYYYKLKERLLLPVVYSGIITVVLWFAAKKKIYKWDFGHRQKRYFICESVLLITLIEVLPFSLTTNPTALSQVNDTDTATQQIIENIGGYKVWDAFDNVDGAHQSIISQNKSQTKGISSLNAYTAYNNPLVVKYFKPLGQDNDNAPFNFSGLLTGSINLGNNLRYQNDFLSMMGVRYVIDSSGVIGQSGGKIYDSSCVASQISSKENVQLNTDGSGLYIGEITGGIQANTCYKIVFTINKEDNAYLTSLIVDLFGGDNYDFAPQEKQFMVSKDNNEYTAYLYSDNIETATEDIRVRIMAQSDAGKVRVDRCDIFTVQPAQAYNYWGQDEKGTAIYENINARDILYFPHRVVHKEDFSDIYDNYEGYDLADTAYVNRDSCELSGEGETVKVLSHKNNLITAQVTSNSDTYLCFSQNYSVGWSAEVDGVKQEVDMVNGVIMGTPVPAGEHTVVFRYRDNSYVIGFTVTGITIVVLISCYVISRRRHNKKP